MQRNFKSFRLHRTSGCKMQKTYSLPKDLYDSFISLCWVSRVCWRQVFRYRIIIIKILKDNVLAVALPIMYNTGVLLWKPVWGNKHKEVHVLLKAFYKLFGLGSQPPSCVSRQEGLKGLKHHGLSWIRQSVKIFDTSIIPYYRLSPSIQV